jgi:hypothetical protein
MAPRQRLCNFYLCIGRAYRSAAQAETLVASSDRSKSGTSAGLAAHGVPQRDSMQESRRKRGEPIAPAYGKAGIVGS